MRAIIVSLLACLLLSCGRAPAPAQPNASLSSLLAAADIAGFERALDEREFQFPDDHYSHPQFKTEWWYLTGNLDNEAGEAFGFQLTFFRFGLTPKTIARSTWRSQSLWMGHLAVTDVARGRFFHAERLSRDGADLAGIAAEPFRLWIEDWSATSTSDEPFPLTLRATDEGLELELELRPTKPPVAHGRSGLDQKGSEPGNASYYYSVPRLSVTGRLGVAGRLHEVSGSAWLDREWSSNALDPALAGWDWVALQLADGRDLMLYRLRTRTGDASAFSSGTLVDRSGNATHLDADDFALTEASFWRSEATGSRYPIAWRLAVPSARLELDLAALIPNQEMNVSVRYWEGAVAARGLSDGRAISARGYLELTGY